MSVESLEVSNTNYPSLISSHPLSDTRYNLVRHRINTKTGLLQLACHIVQHCSENIPLFTPFWWFAGQQSKTSSSGKTPRETPRRDMAGQSLECGSKKCQGKSEEGLTRPPRSALTAIGPATREASRALGKRIVGDAIASGTESN
jgi:hypothetical protein